MCGTLSRLGSVGLRICSDLRGFLTAKRRAHTHTGTQKHTGVALSHLGVTYTCPSDGWWRAGNVHVCVFFVRCLSCSSVRISTPAFFFYELVLVEQRADKDAPFKLRVLDVRCNVPPQVDEIECIIPAYEGLALK